MVKSSKIQIKKDQMKILTELQNDSKVNVNVIVKNCGFSRQKVWRTITQMEKDKTIWGYTAIVDDERIGQKQFTLLIKRTHKPLEKKIIEKIDSIQLEDIALPHGFTIVSSCFIHGTYDWMISFTAQDINHARKFCDLLIKGFPGAIEKIDIQQILYCVRKHHIFNPERKKLRELME
jgi:DNA-binding Lrp family transcriptional regulator